MFYEILRGSEQLQKRNTLWTGLKTASVKCKMFCDLMQLPGSDRSLSPLCGMPEDSQVVYASKKEKSLGGGGRSFSHDHSCHDRIPDSNIRSQDCVGRLQRDDPFSLLTF